MKTVKKFMKKINPCSKSVQYNDQVDKSVHLMDLKYDNEYENVNKLEEFVILSSRLFQMIAPLYDKLCFLN